MFNPFSKAGLIVLGALYLALPLVTPHLNPSDYAGGRSRNLDDRARRNASSVAVMLGEVRTAFSDILLIKTERYLHSGVAYVPHVIDEVASVNEEMEEPAPEPAPQACGSDCEHDHDHEVAHTCSADCDHAAIEAVARTCGAGCDHGPEPETVHVHDEDCAHAGCDHAPILDVAHTCSASCDHGAEPHAGHVHDEHCTHASGELAPDPHPAHGDPGHVHDEHCDFGCDPDTPTVIRGAADDFRGFIGHLQREVKPYQEVGKAHVHGSGEELLPWFRVMTLNDPNHVLGYATGAFWLKGQNTEEALRFVEEGLGHNPTAFQLHLVHGQTLIRMARDRAGDIHGDISPEVRALLERGRDSFHQAAHYALAQRPDDPEAALDTGRWTNYLEDDAFGAARMSALMESKYGNPTKATTLALHYITQFGEDPTLDRIAYATTRPGAAYPTPWGDALGVQPTLGNP